MISKNQLVKILKGGGIGVMPTDTIYGLVGQALDPKTVSRIYKVRKRSPEKPFIILIPSLASLELFGVKLGDYEKKFLKKYWPGEVSVILPCKPDILKYLHRGTNTLAFRLPVKESVLEILKKTGPLVAPSANPEGLPPANNLKEAKKYFGEISLPLTKGEVRSGLGIDFYYGRGELTSPASTLVRLERNKFDILRQGGVVINQ